jgi:hypothetical protein
VEVLYLVCVRMRAAAPIRSWGPKQRDYVDVRDVGERDARTAVDKGEP